MLIRAIKRSTDDDRRTPNYTTAMIRALALFVVLAVAIAAVAFGAFMVLFLSNSWFGVDVFWYEHAQTAAAAATALAMAICGWRIAWNETVEATRVRY